MGEVAGKPVVGLPATESIASARALLSSDEPRYCHQGYPILGADDAPLGVVTRKDLMRAEGKKTLADLISRKAVVVPASMPLSEARDLMVREEIGRLLVTDHKKLSGILTRSDVLRAHSRNLSAESKTETKLAFRRPGKAPVERE